KIYPTLADFCSKLTRSIDETARDLKIPHQVNAIGSMFQVFFTDEPVVDYASSKKSDTKKFEKLFKNLLKKGVFVAPSQFETVFISYAHTHSDIEHTINAYEGALKAVIS
ncbi:MAG: aspartate aminotransferase family protein, partial [Candidatus Nitrosotenuis sp.]